ncbi:hypothetical protein Mgra_00005567 [Meloidogyne graminicola]|uniref:Uncharacterized protein n=1 Tax=Meloidogyne graminicola TaxID=189291 RepID=A0A8S9ZP98_9BILA|nr:hypothetical protein Mgra_00005567 [Meloidogyne graminicola]
MFAALTFVDTGFLKLIQLRTIN